MNNHIRKNYLIFIIFATIIILFFNSTVFGQPITQFSFSTESESYSTGEVVKISIRDYLVPYQKNVYFSVTHVATGNVVFSQTVNTGFSGFASTQFTISDDFDEGTYEIVGTMYFGEDAYSYSSFFDVSNTEIEKSNY